MYFGREYLTIEKNRVNELIEATNSSNVYSNISNISASGDCRILRNDLIRFEDGCYYPIYHWYVALVLIAIMLVFAFFFFLFLCLGLGE